MSVNTTSAGPRCSDSPDEIVRAQFALDHHPQDSRYWDSCEGEEMLGIIADNNLTATTTAEFCREWHNAQMQAARDEVGA